MELSLSYAKVFSFYVSSFHLLVCLMLMFNTYFDMGISVNDLKPEIININLCLF